MPSGQSPFWDPERDELWAVITAEGNHRGQRRTFELARDEDSITWGVDTGHLDREYQVTVTRCPKRVFDFVQVEGNPSESWLTLVEVSTASGTSIGIDIVDGVEVGAGGVGVELEDDLGTSYTSLGPHQGSDFGMVFSPRPPMTARELRIAVVQGEGVLVRYVADLTRPRHVGSGSEAASCDG
ncbi:hypothetical protein [Kineococcus sp. NPDC059986]|uniref:hypothetical protein n=1 Tax=Kineococcus sp. NPDC059986 TaxID=3155538 RepID=UPI003450FB68